MIEIYDVPDAIKKAKLFFVDKYGTITLRYKKIDIDSDSDYKHDEYRDYIYIFDAKEECGAYWLFNAVEDRFGKPERNFFIFLTIDHTNLKNEYIENEHEDLLLKKIQEIYKNYHLWMDTTYRVMESPELYKIIDQWYNLTKHDFSRRRFITV